MIRHVRKVAVRGCVGAEQFDIGKSVRDKRRHRRLTANAMKRRIDNLQIAGTREGFVLQRGEKRGINFFLAEFNAAVCRRLVEVRTLDGADVHYLLDDTFVVRRNELAAGIPIRLEAVIRRRVVAGRDHDAATAVLKADRERKFRRAAKSIKKVNLETGSDQDLGAQPREMSRVVPRVVGDRAGKSSA